VTRGEPSACRDRQNPYGYRTYFTTASDLVSALQSTHLEGNAGAKMRTFTGQSVLVVDELGYLPMDDLSPLDLPGRLASLRARLDRAHVQPRLLRLGRSLRR
jgi:hypothetical protein